MGMADHSLSSTAQALSIDAVRATQNLPLSPSHYLIVCLCLLLPACSLPPTRDFDARIDKTSAASAGFALLPQEKTIDPAWLRPPTAPPHLGPGDKFDIDILGETNARAQTFATPDGKLYYNLLPGIPVTGRTLPQVKQDLEQGLSQYYRHPQISIDLTEANSQRIWVLGRLSHPGIFPLRRPMRVLDAITTAGGLITSSLSGTTQELADLDHSFLIRKGDILPIDFQALLREGDMSQNIYLQPDDYLYLPSSITNEIYLLGAVKSPRPIGFAADMNIIAAIAGGLGLAPNADPRHIVIIRGSLTTPKVASISFPDILLGRATNVRLQPGDIVFVPTRWQTTLQGYGSIATNILGNTSRLAISSFAQVVGANEGARLSQPPAAATPTTSSLAPPVPTTAAVQTTPTL